MARLFGCPHSSTARTGVHGSRATQSQKGTQPTMMMPVPMSIAKLSPPSRLETAKAASGSCAKRQVTDRSRGKRVSCRQSEAWNARGPGAPRRLLGGGAPGALGPLRRTRRTGYRKGEGRRCPDFWCLGVAALSVRQRTKNRNRPVE
jgi:hypothetical protein